MSVSARRRAWTLPLAGLAAIALAVPLMGAAPAPAVRAAAIDAPLTNLAHLDFLLDEATPPANVAGHTTYRLAEEPTLVMPWTYADARDGGRFERVGGGPLDPETGDWGQGAYNADDITRAAVVYIRHWKLTGSDDSRQKAYELLRSTAYLQTTEGENAGRVVLWMQPDGDLNPSAEPIELPDPSDSGPSYWVARTVWALGEGYAAFKDADPAFAAFLAERLALSRGSLERDVLSKYGQYEVSDGMRVPARLIVNGADATAEAVLGLAARVQAAPGDTASRDALAKFAEAIAKMGAGSERAWPYGAVLPWAESPAFWHAWGSQMPAALAVASQVLGDRSLAAPAVADAAVFTPTLLTAGGPDNGWSPTPTDRVQIAYGADSRVQSLLAVADATGSPAFTELAGMQAAWFFGANRAGAVMYDRTTGVTYDGLQVNGDVNRNSGAESTIHGLLTAIALDARPDVKARALGVTDVVSRTGLRVIEAEDATASTGTVSTPSSSWTGESAWSGDSLTLAAGQRATFDLGTDATARWVEPVVWSEPGEKTLSLWRAGSAPLGVLRADGVPQGISPTPGALLPGQLQLAAGSKATTATVSVLRGELTLDALIVRPLVSSLVLDGTAGRTELIHSAARGTQRATIGDAGASTVHVYDAKGKLRKTVQATGPVTVLLPSGGLAIATR